MSKSEHLRPSSTQLLWITDIYGFMVAGFLITMGTLGDRIGRRRLLLIGAAAFGLVSVFAALSTSPEQHPARRFGLRQAVVAVWVAAGGLAWCSTAAVLGSAGKNDSIASSATVMSSGVPKVATVLRKASSRP
jgi:MFS family permease